MSRYHHYQPSYNVGYGYGPRPAAGLGGVSTGFGGYNFTTLIALILIVLVFGSKQGGKYGKGYGWSGGVLDNSILFIIAFFFLACGCGGRGFGASCGC